MNIKLPVRQEPDQAQVLEELDGVLYGLYTDRQNIESAEASKTTHQSRALELFKLCGNKTRSFVFKGTKFHATVVEPERITVDEERLKKALGAALWEKVSTRKLDKEKLEAAIALNLVDPVTVAECSISKITPYVKVTDKGEK